jgi:hypothetical protein
MNKRSIFFLLVLLIDFSELPLFSQALIPREAKNGKCSWCHCPVREGSPVSVISPTDFLTIL